MESHDEKNEVRPEPESSDSGDGVAVPRSKSADVTEGLPDPASEPATDGDGPAAQNGESAVSYDQTTDADQDCYDPEYGYRDAPPPDSPASSQTAIAEQSGGVPPPVATGPGAPPPPPPPPGNQDEDSDDDGMLRMSFLEHLEELRVRIIRALMGVGVAFFASLIFVDVLWAVVSAPAIRAMKEIGIEDPKLVMLTPTESFSIIWIKVPILTAIFLSSPWILYQVWSFVAPGLYKRERSWAAPFIISAASLFILGGLFAYFVAFPLGLAFLLGIGLGNEVQPMVSIAYYFDLFVNVSLGMAVVFQLPVLIFFLALLRIVTPRFLLENSRYAILIIVIVAAIITPTPDAINLMLVSVPMGVLYFLGVFAAYLLTLSRENRGFPWLILFMIFGIVLVLAGATVYLAVARYGFKLQSEWPFLVQ